MFSNNANDTGNSDASSGAPTSRHTTTTNQHHHHYHLPQHHQQHQPRQQPPPPGYAQQQQPQQQFAHHIHQHQQHHHQQQQQQQPVYAMAYPAGPAAPAAPAGGGHPQPIPVMMAPGGGDHQAFAVPGQQHQPVNVVLAPPSGAAPPPGSFVPLAGNPQHYYQQQQQQQPMMVMFAPSGSDGTNNNSGGSGGGGGSPQWVAMGGGGSVPVAVVQPHQQQVSYQPPHHFQHAQPAGGGQHFQQHYQQQHQQAVAPHHHDHRPTRQHVITTGGAPAERQQQGRGAVQGSAGNRGGGSDALLRNTPSLKSRIAAAVAKVTVAGPTLDEISALQRLLSRANATDGEAHAAWLECVPLDVAVAIARATVRALAESTTSADHGTAPSLRDMHRPLWNDLAEHRGLLTIALVDMLISAPPQHDGGEGAHRALAGELVDLALLRHVSELAETQRGCISLMRLVSCVHHDAPLITRVVAALTPAAASGALLRGLHKPFVLCHVIVGLRQPPPAARAGEAGPPAAATATTRANHIVDFAPWTAAYEQEPTAARARELARDRCDAAVWAGFTAAVYAGLVEAFDVVLDGRQACFVLWYALRALGHHDSPAEPASELRDLTTALLNAKAVKAVVGPAPAAGSDEPDGVDGQPRLLLPPAAALCRSTPGRCALVAGLTGLAARRELAARLASLRPLPAVDADQERTLKQRPGMDAAASLERAIDAALGEE